MMPTVRAWSTRLNAEKNIKIRKLMFHASRLYPLQENVMSHEKKVSRGNSASHTLHRVNKIAYYVSVNTISLGNLFTTLW